MQKSFDVKAIIQYFVTFSILKAKFQHKTGFFCYVVQYTISSMYIYIIHVLLTLLFVHRTTDHSKYREMQKC